MARPLPPPPATTPEAPPPPAPPAPVAETPVVTAPPVVEDPMATRSIDELNRESPMRVVYYLYDSAELSAEARAALDANAAVLKKYPAWTMTIEGHCDERGTAEYNLALGERRAVSAQSYLVALGIPASRVKVSATARSSRSTPATTRPPGPRTGARTSSSPGSRPGGSETIP